MEATAVTLLRHWFWTALALGSAKLHTVSVKHRLALLASRKMKGCGLTTSSRFGRSGGGS